MTYHWINLTNGLEALPKIPEDQLQQVRFMRIQSTWCEQKQWARVLDSVPDEFLLLVARAHCCRVYDAGAHKTTPRAVWQGLEWVKYCLDRRWHHREYRPQGRACSSIKYFDQQYRALARGPLKRLDYYQAFLTDHVCARSSLIQSWTHATQRDGDRVWMASQLNCMEGTST